MSECLKQRCGYVPHEGSIAQCLEMAEHAAAARGVFDDNWIYFSGVALWCNMVQEDTQSPTSIVVTETTTLICLRHMKTIEKLKFDLYTESRDLST